MLERAVTGEPAPLPETPRFLSLDMMAVIHKIISYQLDPSLAKMYFSSLVQELLTLLSIQVNLASDKVFFSAADLRQAQDARKMILADFESYFTVEELAKKLGTTEMKLQSAFKHLYGQTVSEFSREASSQRATSCWKRRPVRCASFVK